MRKNLVVLLSLIIISICGKTQQIASAKNDAKDTTETSVPVIESESGDIVYNGFEKVGDTIISYDKHKLSDNIKGTSGNSLKT
jgi:hypothetical protein